jgi:CopG antitoxin of type II toxin-antitoxin system
MKKARTAADVFANEAEERAYWERKKSTAHLDWDRTKPVRLPNLQPSTTSVWAQAPVEPFRRRSRSLSISATCLSPAYQDLA